MEGILVKIVFWMEEEWRNEEGWTDEKETREWMQIAVVKGKGRKPIKQSLDAYAEGRVASSTL